MTIYRRQIITNNFDHSHCPIIFNEYMFASWNCPSHQTALSLAPTAKKLGAEYYVIDCGWHDEIENPFYHVGRWEESRTKYPEGLKKTLDFIRSLGLKPGLWLEPEVVGAQGDAISIWDKDCYFHRDGKPLIVSNRYQLNFSNAKVIEFFIRKIDELVQRYGVEYFKFDYNIEPGIGFDQADQSLGDALLEHNRAYHHFIDMITKRHPHVIFEGCASGGNRMDYLTLDNVHLVSTSDQTDYLIYPYIVANILTAVLPTQAAIWCYPKIESISSEDTTFEQINLNIINCLIGRVHLASKLNLLCEEQQAFIARGMAYYHQLDELRNEGVPYFPNGLVSLGD
jgi:alpha-galactosidase